MSDNDIFTFCDFFVIFVNCCEKLKCRAYHNKLYSIWLNLGSIYALQRNSILFYCFGIILLLRCLRKRKFRRHCSQRTFRRRRKSRRGFWQHAHQNVRLDDRSLSSRAIILYRYRQVFGKGKRKAADGRKTQLQVLHGCPWIHLRRLQKTG